MEQLSSASILLVKHLSTTYFFGLRQVFSDGAKDTLETFLDGIDSVQLQIDMCKSILCNVNYNYFLLI